MDKDENAKILDLGCGVGTTCRFVAKEFSAVTAIGVSIVPEQVITAHRLTREAGVQNKATFFYGDYTDLSFETDSFNGALAIESACYANGDDKVDFLKEAYRILKPGSTLVITDAFRKHPDAMQGVTGKLYRAVCDNWAVDDFAEFYAFRKALFNVGFKEIHMTDVSWNVAPSALHVPWVCLKFLAQQVLKGERLKPWSWRNVKASFMGMLLGMCQKDFGYYLISAKK